MGHSTASSPGKVPSTPHELSALPTLFSILRCLHCLIPQINILYISYSKIRCSAENYCIKLVTKATYRYQASSCVICQLSQGSVIIVGQDLRLQVLQVELFHYAKGTTHFWVLAHCRHPFPAKALDPPVPRVTLVTIAKVNGNLMNATRVENEEWFEVGTRVDTRDANGMAQLNSEAHFFE